MKDTESGPPNAPAAFHRLSRRSVLGLFGFAVASSTIGGGLVASPAFAEAFRPDLKKSDIARLRAIQTRGVALQHNIIDFWKAHGPDPLGGFYGELDREGNPTDVTTKYAHMTARHLWSFCSWYRLKEQTPEVAAICHSLAAFLDNFLDAQDGRYSYAVLSDGSAVTDNSKMLYAQAFVMLAYSTYGEVFDQHSARDKALALFRKIDTTHDAVNGGFDQSADDWYFASPAAVKSMNVHMHLTEAITAVYKATGDATAKSRVAELTSLFPHKILQPERYYHTEFDAAWNPVATPPSVEYGHDLQIFWQMNASLDAIGSGGKSKTTHTLVRAAKVAAAAGLDGTYGYSTYGVPSAALIGGNKDWWVQAEAMNGLLRLFLMTGQTVQLDRLESTLSFVEKAFVDHEFGELYPATTRAGELTSDTRKGYEWKASYHALRAALQLDTWVADALAGRLD